MRTRELVIAALLCGCASNPDPREPSIQTMERSGRGSWIVVTTAMGEGTVDEGELIAFEPDRIYLLRKPNTTRAELVELPIAPVIEAVLYRYEYEAGFGGWGLLGTLSTISHGFLLGLTAPIWMLSSGIAAAVESRHVIVRYPQRPLRELAIWARFPQGLPPGIDVRALTERGARPQPASPSAAPVTAPGPSPLQLRLAVRQRAWELTQQAWAAARAEDCATVLELSGHVQTMDPELHEATFLRDVAVRACLGLAPIPRPAPSMPDPQQPPQQPSPQQLPPPQP